jgi:hypothetical protein
VKIELHRANSRFDPLNTLREALPYMSLLDLAICLERYKRSRSKKTSIFFQGVQFVMPRLMAVAIIEEAVMEKDT